MTRFITGAALHVSEALLDPESRGWVPFWLQRLLSRPLSSSTRASKRRRMCLFASFSKLRWHHPKSCLLVTQSLLLLLLLLPPISVPALPRSFAPPTGLALLLTGVICASRIDVVCRPIKIFEGNVYFLERIAAAAWKPF